MDFSGIGVGFILNFILYSLSFLNEAYVSKMEIILFKTDSVQRLTYCRSTGKKSAKSLSK